MRRINTLHNYFYRGFTLIELVLVIVILGIIAASAVPKYINVTSDARIARLQALRGAIRSVDQMVYAKTAIQNVSRNNDAWATHNNYVVLEGIQYHVKYGHIDRNNIGYFIDGTPQGAVEVENNRVSLVTISLTARIFRACVSMNGVTVIPEQIPEFPDLKITIAMLRTAQMMPPRQHSFLYREVWSRASIRRISAFWLTDNLIN